MSCKSCVKAGNDGYSEFNLIDRSFDQIKQFEFYPRTMGSVRQGSNVKLEGT